MEHACQRKALAPAFSTSAVKELLPVFWEKSLKLTNLLDGKLPTTGDAASIEVLELVNCVTLDVICLAALGKDIDSLGNPEHELRRAYRSLFPFDLISRLTLAMMTFSISFKQTAIEN